MPVTRRDFAKGLFAVAGASAAGCRSGGALAPGALDPLAVGVISDVHTGLPWSRQRYRTGREYPWQPGASKRLVGEILALPNPPANVIGLGDLSLAFGEPGTRCAWTWRRRSIRPSPASTPTSAR